MRRDQNNLLCGSLKNFRVRYFSQKILHTFRTNSYPHLCVQRAANAHMSAIIIETLLRFAREAMVEF